MPWWGWLLVGLVVLNIAWALQYRDVREWREKTAEVGLWALVLGPLMVVLEIVGGAAFAIYYRVFPSGRLRTRIYAELKRIAADEVSVPRLESPRRRRARVRLAWRTPWERWQETVNEPVLAFGLPITVMWEGELALALETMKTLPDKAGTAAFWSAFCDTLPQAALWAETRNWKGELEDALNTRPEAVHPSADLTAFAQVLRSFTPPEPGPSDEPASAADMSRGPTDDVAVQAWELLDQLDKMAIDAKGQPFGRAVVVDLDPDEVAAIISKLRVIELEPITPRLLSALDEIGQLVQQGKPQGRGAKVRVEALPFMHILDDIRMLLPPRPTDSTASPAAIPE